MLPLPGLSKSTAGQLCWVWYVWCWCQGIQAWKRGPRSMMSPKARTDCGVRPQRISHANQTIRKYTKYTVFSDVYWEPGPSCWLQCSVASWVFLVLLWDTLPCLKHKHAVLSFDRYCILCSIQWYQLALIGSCHWLTVCGWLLLSVASAWRSGYKLHTSDGDVFPIKEARMAASNLKLTQCAAIVFTGFPLQSMVSTCFYSSS